MGRVSVKPENRLQGNFGKFLRDKGNDCVAGLFIDNFDKVIRYLQVFFGSDLQRLPYIRLNQLIHIRFNFSRYSAFYDEPCQVFFDFFISLMYL